MCSARTFAACDMQNVALKQAVCGMAQTKRLHYSLLGPGTDWQQGQTACQILGGSHILSQL